MVRNGLIDYLGQSFKNGPSKICGRQLFKNCTQSILAYFDSYVNGFHEIPTKIKHLLQVFMFNFLFKSGVDEYI